METLFRTDMLTLSCSFVFLPTMNKKKPYLFELQKVFPQIFHDSTGNRLHAILRVLNKKPKTVSLINRFNVFWIKILLPVASRPETCVASITHRPRYNRVGLDRRAPLTGRRVTAPVFIIVCVSVCMSFRWVTVLFVFGFDLIINIQIFIFIFYFFNYNTRRQCGERKEFLFRGINADLATQSGTQWSCLLRVFMSVYDPVSYLWCLLSYRTKCGMHVTHLSGPICCFAICLLGSLQR